MTRREIDVLVVGGGPAGLAAAVSARRIGATVTVVDERSELGGQIYKRLPVDFRVRAPSALGEDYATGEELIAQAKTSGAEILLNTTAWGIWGRDVAVHEDRCNARLTTAKQIVLATGAYDRPVVFPGWTLPGVMTAGAAQALVKTQRVLPGHRVLMVGTGPLLLAFAAQLHQHGANIVAVCDASPRPKIEAARLAWAARGSLKRLRRGIGYHAYLRAQRVPFLYSHLVTSVDGDGRVEVARIAEVDSEWRPTGAPVREMEVDTVCVGYGFMPSNELSILSGCKHRYDEQLGGLVPERDAMMRSSIPHLLVAGDGAGVEGADIARAEGRIAGAVAAAVARGLSVDEMHAVTAPARRDLRVARRFGHALRRTYPIKNGAYMLAEDETVVCRCEGVSSRQIWETTQLTGADANGVKNVTRAGMGLCQGRMCGAQVASLVAKRAGIAMGQVSRFNPRPPIKPLPIESLEELDQREAGG